MTELFTMRTIAFFEGTAFTGLATRKILIDVNIRIGIADGDEGENDKN